jgi:hypothetical protein
MAALKIIAPFSMAEQGPCFYRHNNPYNFEENKHGPYPIPLYNLHRQAINACFTERKKTKREAGKCFCQKY